MRGHSTALGLDEFIPVPEGNSSTEAKIELGRQLFFDKGLSRDGTVACVTCHVPEKAFANNQRVAIGIKGRLGKRNVPTILNRAYGKSFFWEGRGKSLEEQPLTAITNRNEMDLTLAEFEKRLKELTIRSNQARLPFQESQGGARQSVRAVRESSPELRRARSDAPYAGPSVRARQRATAYRQQFQEVFDEPPSAQNASKAIATFVRTLLSGNSAFDRFEHGDQNALSESAKRGLQIFRGKGNCIACHNGPLLSDEEFHNTGVSWGKAPLDLGRYEVTKQDADRGKFKTPSLRNVALTAPYMHDGSLATLENVVELYSKGGNPNANLDREIRSLNLTSEEQADLLAFLRSLSGGLR